MDVEALKTNEAVIKARDEFAKNSAPKNYYSFERDFKSFKNEPERLLSYLSNISGEDYKIIFRSDLEPDVLLCIL